MIQSNQNIRILELDSSKRNRNIYPNPSSFEATLNLNTRNNIVDPVCKGGIYYSFKIYNRYAKYARGFFAQGSTRANPILKISGDFLTPEGISGINDDNAQIIVEKNNFFVGWRIGYYADPTLGEFNLLGNRIVKTYDPITGVISLDKPFDDVFPGNAYYQFLLYQIYPTNLGMYLPTVDINGMVINKTPLHYNGYYIIFENPNSNYSNSTNSNIFSRRISYYDSETQFIYFDEPINFTFEFDYLQSFTVRKSLPLERWTLNKTTYYKTTKADNSIIGPLPGYVVILPDEASSIDNYYKEKYIYVVSNPANSYSPPLPPKEYILPINNSFYPTYGLFLIKAYNGNTKEASIEYIPNKEKLNFNSIPTYLPITNINVFDIVPYSNLRLGYFGPSGQYGAKFNEINDSFYLTTGQLRIENLIPGKQYKVLCVTGIYYQGYDQKILLQNGLNEGVSIGYYYDPVYITTYYDYLIIYYEVKIYGPVPIGFIGLEYLSVSLADTINIVELEYDNYSPLDYNGTIVSANQNVCHEISIESITLPNTKLLTGSSIAFYPFVYIKLENATTPIGVSPNTIISNNPPSTGTIFSVYVPQVDQPEFQKFITLTGGGTQIIKFNPNDNLRFSVYLPDGTLFTSLLPDVLSPYPPDPLLQIHAVFNLIRMN